MLAHEKQSSKAPAAPRPFSPGFCLTALTRNGRSVLGKMPFSMRLAAPRDGSSTFDLEPGDGWPASRFEGKPGKPMEDRRASPSL